MTLLGERVVEIDKTPFLSMLNRDEFSAKNAISSELNVAQIVAAAHDGAFFAVLGVA